MPELLDLDALTVTDKTNPKIKERQSEYDSAIKAIATGKAAVFVVGTGKDTARGLKLRLSYAVKRTGRTDIEVGEGTRKSDGAAIVFAKLAAPAPAKSESKSKS